MTQGKAMTDSTAPNTLILLVTRRTTAQILSWADVATSTRDAMTMWKEKRYPYVFADLGDLGEGVSGARLAAMIHKENPDITIMLMSDRVQPHQIAWARTYGATGVILRTAEAISSCLPREVRPPNLSEFPSGFPMDDSPEAIEKVVDERLHKYAHLGPARSVVLQDAMQELLEERKGLPPTAYELAVRVADEITSESERAAFLNSFTGAK
jgi:hypothetical protein